MTPRSLASYLDVAWGE
jgi:hypothetical protein